MKLILMVSLIAFLCLPSHAEEGNRFRENPPSAEEYYPGFQFVFLAVLEGLYEDGVSGEALEMIIPYPETMLINEDPTRTNFVYNCPLCNAAFSALRVYLERPEFFGQKTTRYNTFGPGVSDETLALLKGAPEERRDAIQDMIQDWVSRRLEGQKMTENERAALEADLEAMKRRGDELLASFKKDTGEQGLQKYYAGWKNCPVCEGATAMGAAVE